MPFDVGPVAYCQMCCQLVGDAWEMGSNETEEWVYCSKCDVWTAHPVIREPGVCLIEEN